MSGKYKIDTGPVNTEGWMYERIIMERNSSTDSVFIEYQIADNKEMENSDSSSINCNDSLFYKAIEMMSEK